MEGIFKKGEDLLKKVMQSDKPPDRLTLNKLTNLSLIKYRLQKEDKERKNASDIIYNYKLKINTDNEKDVFRSIVKSSNENKYSTKPKTFPLITRKNKISEVNHSIEMLNGSVNNFKKMEAYYKKNYQNSPLLKMASSDGFNNHEFLKSLYNTKKRIISHLDFGPLLTEKNEILKMEKDEKKETINHESLNSTQRGPFDKEKISNISEIMGRKFFITSNGFYKNIKLSNHRQNSFHMNNKRNNNNNHSLAQSIVPNNHNLTQTPNLIVNSKYKKILKSAALNPVKVFKSIQTSMDFNKSDASPWAVEDSTISKKIVKAFNNNLNTSTISECTQPNNNKNPKFKNVFSQTKTPNFEHYKYENINLPTKKNEEKKYLKKYVDFINTRTKNHAIKIKLYGN